MPGTPLAVPSAPFALPAAAPGSLPPSGGLPTPLPVSVAPFGTGLSSSLSADIKLSHGGIAGLFQRQPGLKYVVAVLAIVALIILLGMVILRGERETRSETAALAQSEPLQATEPKLAAAEIPAPPPAQQRPAPVRQPSEPSRRKSFSGKSVHHGGHATERPVKEKAPAGPPRLNGARPNPFDEAKSVSQSLITAVVRNPANQSALKSCYERALKMDNHLTSGRIDVTVSIGTSGAVQRVVINAPSSFILVEPCIKGAVKRWVFPPNTEEYATNFPLIMQGGM
jgi:outer membrane biosynthesis protein TonB